MMPFVSTAKAKEALHRATAAAKRKFIPPPKLTTSTWADEERRLSSVDSAEPGRWDTATAEYQREIMNAFSDAAVQDIVMMTAAQVGKSAIILNCEGFLIACDPGPVLHILPTKDDAQEFSKDRFTEGLVAATPCLQGKVSDIKSGASAEKSTIDHKRFPGGRLTFAWSNSASRLSSRPIRYVFADEIDKFTPHPTQGDPIERARKRSATYQASRKHVWASTPTLKGEGGSIIDAMYTQSSRGHYVVPCPECTTEGVVGFFHDSLGVEPARGFHIAWDKDADGNHLTDQAHIVCHACGAVIEERFKSELVRHGHWIHEDQQNRTRGFHLSATISPWSTWSELAAKFLAAGPNAEKLRIFWNEELGEAWQIRGEMISDNSLLNRREEYKAACPAGVVVLTAGVDVQRDRIEATVIGWGLGLERWHIAHEVLRGSPAESEVWLELDGLLDQTWEHENGAPLGICATFIDSAGSDTQAVYSYCRTRWQRFIFPIVGRANSPGMIRPLISKPTAQASGVKLWSVGVDVAKEGLYRCLRIDKSGPGFWHFPQADWCDEEFFAQLCAERLVVKTKGYRVQKCWEKTRDRNEVLDCSAYAFAAFEARRVNLAAAKANLEARAVHKKRVPEPPTVIVGAPAPAVEPVAKVAEPAASAPGRFKKPPRYPEMGPRFGGGSGWVNNWKQF